MNSNTKKILGIILVVAILCVSAFILTGTAKAAEAAPSGNYLISETSHITFLTSNQSLFERLQAKYGKYFNVKVVFTGKKSAPTFAPFPTPPPAPEPTPVPQPTPASTPDPDPDNGLTAAEQRMFELVNQDRAAAGLPPLQIDMRLVRAARIKSQDMQDKGYFAHTSPDGTTPWDLIKDQGVTYRAAGENIAMGFTNSDAAEHGFMSSPGHKANILNKDFNHVGIGIVGNYYTQEFAGF